MLLYHINSRGEICIDSQRDIAEMTGISQPSVGRALKELEQLGYINRGLLGSKMGFCLNDSLLCSIQSESKVIQSESSTTESVIQSESKRFRENQSDSERIKVIQCESPSKEEIKEKNIRGKERGRGVPFSPSLSESKSEKSSLRKTASMINMLSDVAKIPAEGNWVILEDLAKWLVSQEIEPAQIGKHYGRKDPGNGVWWWYRDFWKGKKGEYPEKPTDIRNTILKAVEFEPLPVQQVETKATGKAADATQRAIAKLRAQAAA